MDVINKWDAIATQCKLLKMEGRNYMIMDSFEDIKSYIYPIPDVSGAIRYRTEMYPFFDEMGEEPDKYFEVKMVAKISRGIDVQFGIVNRGRYVIKKKIYIDTELHIQQGFVTEKFEQLIDEIDNSLFRNYYKSILMEMQ